MPENEMNAKDSNDPNAPLVNTEVQQSENGAHVVDKDLPDGKDTTLQLSQETQQLLDKGQTNPPGTSAENAPKVGGLDPVQEPDAAVGDSVDPEPAPRPITGGEPDLTIPSGPTGVPAVSSRGHRNMFVNGRGEFTLLDDDSAEVFFTDPKRYEQTYDSGKGDAEDVRNLRWCDVEGNVTGGTVGEAYTLDD